MWAFVESTVHMCACHVTVKIVTSSAAVHGKVLRNIRLVAGFPGFRFHPIAIETPVVYVKYSSSVWRETRVKEMNR